MNAALGGCPYCPYEKPPLAPFLPPLLQTPWITCDIIFWIVINTQALRCCDTASHSTLLLHTPSNKAQFSKHSCSENWKNSRRNSVCGQPTSTSTLSVAPHVQQEFYSVKILVIAYSFSFLLCPFWIHTKHIYPKWASLDSDLLMLI